MRNIVVFGDSLSDNGNLYEYLDHQVPQSPPYYEGRFTNGPLWIERLLSYYYPNDYKEHLKDYAFGGAGVGEDGANVFFSLKSEIDSYLLSNEKAAPNDLFVLWIGANNYLDVPENASGVISRVNSGIQRSVQRLINSGARNVLLLNLPDLGKTPAAKDLGAKAQASLTAICAYHNQALLQVINRLKQNNPQVNFLYYDVNALINTIYESPASYGFTNTEEACYNVYVDKPSQKMVFNIAAQVKPKVMEIDCNNYLFFDPVHPSAPAHQLMAEAIHNLFEESNVRFVNN